jgi:cation transport regulator ChaC
MDSIFIFGYGSLLNEQSRKKTFSERRAFEDVVLKGYQRKLNASCDQWPAVAMNIVPNNNHAITGVVVEVPLVDFPKLLERESGYDQVEVTAKIVNVKFEVPVFTFIAPDIHHGDKKAYQTYLDTCLGGVPTDTHDRWLAETIIECDIIDDRLLSQYNNVA